LQSLALNDQFGYPFNYSDKMIRGFVWRDIGLIRCAIV